MIFKEKDLVLFKYRPAIIKTAGEKCELIFEDGSSKKIPEKNLSLLANGPVSTFSQLTITAGDVKEAWQLLQGEPVEFSEVVEIIHGEISPNAAYSTWKTITAREYFKFNGKLDQIEVVSEETYLLEKKKKEEKEAATKRWEAFLERLKAGPFSEEDREYYQEIEQLALGCMKKNRSLAAIGLEQSPESAHRLLLKKNFWQNEFNPYPQRFDLPTTVSDINVPELPEEERVDLTHLKSYAIDDEGNKDPDDAIGIDGDTIWVHVADCAALVQVDSELDNLAKDRGANQYLPETIIPMLPPAIVEQLGLGLQETSPALSFAIELDEQGEASIQKIVKSWVKVERWTYQDANAVINDKFAVLYAKTELFNQKRRNNGAAVIRLPEVKVKVDDEKQVSIKPLPAYESRKMVTDAMLMAGEAVSKFCLDNEIPIPFVSQLFNCELAAEFEDLDGIARMFANRKCFKRSQISCSPGSHDGLGMEVYTRVTSPMRRYLDLVIHQQIRAFIDGKPVLSEDDILNRIALSESISGCVSGPERNSNLHWKLVYLLQNPEWSGVGHVVDEYNGRYTILVPELALDAKVKLPKELSLNTEVKVSVNQINLAELSVSFRVEI